MPKATKTKKKKVTKTKAKPKTKVSAKPKVSTKPKAAPKKIVAPKGPVKISKTYEPKDCLLYTSPSPRDATLSRMPSSA